MAANEKYQVQGQGRRHKPTSGGHESKHLASKSAKAAETTPSSNILQKIQHKKNRYILLYINSSLETSPKITPSVSSSDSACISWVIWNVGEKGNFRWPLPDLFNCLSKVHECKCLTSCIYEVTQKRRSDGILWELHSKLMWLLHHYLLSSDASLLHEANIAEEINPSLDYTNLCYHPLKINKQKKIVLHIGHHDIRMHWSVDTE